MAALERFARAFERLPHLRELTGLHVVKLFEKIFVVVELGWQLAVNLGHAFEGRAPLGQCELLEPAPNTEALVLLEPLAGHLVPRRPHLAGFPARRGRQEATCLRAESAKEFEKVVMTREKLFLIGVMGRYLRPLEIARWGPRMGRHELPYDRQNEKKPTGRHNREVKEGEPLSIAPELVRMLAFRSHSARSSGEP